MVRLARSGAGTLLLELVLALALGALVLTSLGALVSVGVRWTRSLADRVEGLEVVRTVWVVTEEELRIGRPSVDWWLDDAGAIQLRSFQGFGRICARSIRTRRMWAMCWLKTARR